MNEQVKKLYGIGKKNSRLIVGLMSGTSLDGLDVALCKVEGHGLNTKLSLIKFSTVNYDADFKEEIKKIFAKKIIDLELLCLLNEWIGIKHAGILNECLQNWKIPNDHIDLVASHGQTIYHAPGHSHQNKKYGNGTLQIGDGDHIAVKTGIITISDFRQKHVAAGGEGAPLAAYGDCILFAEKDKDVFLLNIGGISNFTFIPAGESLNKIICSDIGPGNTLMDAYMQAHFPDKFFDDNATIARQGAINESLLAALKAHEFFSMPFPKTTGPELFNLSFLEKAMIESNTLSISIFDTMATLNAFTAITICEALLLISVDKKTPKMYVSGGGIHNPLLMNTIRNKLPEISVKSTAEKNVDPDAKEAILFAILANECVAGESDFWKGGTANFPVVTMGKISFPN